MDPLVSEIDYLAGVVVREEARMSSVSESIKRIFDIVFAGAALVLLAPFILLVAVMIKVESRGSIFYKQERIGLNRRQNDRRRSEAQGYEGPERRRANDRRKKIHSGKPFSMYKLRTMRSDAEKDGPALSAGKEDSRITKIGRLLRRTRIDEIPQFINVIRGDMSIVGPRPERSFFINQVRQEVPEFPLRLKVKPGITGLAQVEDGYADTVEKMKGKLYYDLKYISRLSLFQEISILFKTVYVVISGKGAC
jgi:lipopolysaccharide/colanic/teichoic acid biosynthesis glycosyltransferase